jgi:DNA-binding MarR family transcriptional regulator
MKRSATGNPGVMTLIAKVHLTWKRHLERALVGEDITLKQFHLLVQLDEHELMRPAQVAEELFCDRPTASVILRNMEKRDWISRTKDPENKKHVRVRLLAAGRRKLAHVRDLPELNRRFAFDPCGGLTKKDAASFVSFLEQLLGRMEREARR